MGWGEQFQDLCISRKLRRYDEDEYDSCYRRSRCWGCPRTSKRSRCWGFPRTPEARGVEVSEDFERFYFRRLGLRLRLALEDQTVCINKLESEQNSTALDMIISRLHPITTYIYAPTVSSLREPRAT